MHTVIPELVIEPGRVEKNYWRDLWRYRELFYILSWRDLRVRYKQTVIGFAWAVIRPVLTMLIFTVVFGYLASFKAVGGPPYPIVVFAGMVPWQFMATALSEASGSLIGNANLLTKVYFPRIIIPVSSIIVSLTDSAIAFALLLLMMAGYGYVPPLQILLLPVFALQAFLLAVGLGLFVTALNVKYRDFRYIIPFIVQIGTYVAPVGYSSAVISQRFSDTARVWYSLNPAVGIIDGFRWCIIGEPLYYPAVLMSAATTLAFVGLGVRHFRMTEKSFADNI